MQIGFLFFLLEFLMDLCVVVGVVEEIRWVDCRRVLSHSSLNCRRCFWHFGLFDLLNILDIEGGSGLFCFHWLNHHGYDIGSGIFGKWRRYYS